MNSAPLIATANLCRYFFPRTSREVRALDGVSITIPPRSFTALTGTSGSGKTTLLSLIGLLDRPTAGTLTVLGRNFSGCSDFELARFRRRMGYVFQDFALIPRLTVMDNIGYPLIPRGVSSQKRHAIARELLIRLEMSDHFAKRPEELSGGERQRVAFARALAGQPEILLADEPTSNLDPESGQNIVNLLRELHSSGTTIIVATHDQSLIAMATHRFHLKSGRLILQE